MDDILPIKEPETTEPDQKETGKVEFSTSYNEEESYARRVIPIGVAAVGRSVKFRDLYTTSGALVCESTTVSVAADTSSGNETDLKSFKFFPNEWHVGMAIRIHAAGTYTSDGTRTVKLRIGSGLAATSEWNSMTSTAASTTNAPWRLQWVGIITSIGPSGTLEAQMQGAINNVLKDDPNTATVSIATNSSVTIALTCDWDGTDAGNSLTIRHFIIEVLY